MATRVAEEYGSSEPYIKTAPSARSTWSVALLFITVGYQFLRVGCVVCVIACLICVFQQDAPRVSIALFAQWACISGLYSGVLYCMRGFFKRACLSTQSLFSRSTVGLIRRLAILFVAIFASGALFSLLATLASQPEGLSVALDLPLAGFPSSAEWESVLSGTNVESSFASVSLDLSPLFAALFAWGLSYVLDYSAVLQNEMEQVV